MKKEYDFSKAEQGKFYCKPEKLKIPVYLDSILESFLSGSKNKLMNHFYRWGAYAEAPKSDAQFWRLSYVCRRV